MRGREHPAILLPLAAALLAYFAGRGDWLLPAVAAALLAAGYVIPTPSWWHGWGRAALVMVPATVAAFFYQQTFLKSPGLSLYIFDPAILATISVLMAVTLPLLWYWPPDKNRAPNLLLASFMLVLLSGNVPDRPLYVPAVALYILCLVLYFRWAQGRALKPRPAGIGDRLVDFLAFGFYLVVAAGLGCVLVTAVAGSQGAMMSLAAEAVRLYEGGASMRFSDSMKLGSFTGLEDSQDPVMSLQGTGPVDSYLRCQTFSSYDKGKWKNDRPAAARPLPEPPTPGGARQLAPAGGTPKSRWSYRVNLVVAMGAVLPLPQGATGVAAGFSVLYDPATALISAPAGQNPQQYAIEGFDGPLSGDTAGALAQFLTMSDDLRATIAATASRITAGAATDATRARAVAKFFSGYGYSLKPKSGMKGDPIENFVLSRKSGFCQDFASAAVMLLRAAGVPARLVSGFLAQESRAGGEMIVRRRDAHAWVEYYDRAAGRWQRLDPTPLSAMNDALGIRQPTALSRFFDRTRIRLRLLADAIRQGNLRAVLRSINPIYVAFAAGAVFAGIAAVLLYRARRRLRFRFRRSGAILDGRRRAAPAGVLTEVYARFLTEIARRGVLAPENETAAEVLARVEAAPAGQSIIQPCTEFITAWNEARFCKSSPEAMARSASSLERILAGLHAVPLPGQPSKK